MHIVIVTDQHPDSLGGAQVSIRLQRAYLERAGHTVTIVSPRKGGVRGDEQADPQSYPGHLIELPGFSLTRDREYAASWPGRASVRRVMRALDGAKVDLVHVQGDFWGALIGYQLARALGVPVVNTMHNNLDVGTRAVAPKLAGLVFAVLGGARRVLLGPLPAGARRARGGWRYLAALAEASDAVVAPSAHFARDLTRSGVHAGFDVVPTGVDDAVINRIRERPREVRSAVTRFVWCGRMSPEKRVLPLIEAFGQLAHERDDVELTVIGSGLQLADAKAAVRRAGCADRVCFTGSLSHEDTLTELHRADALVQTSIGFETQGMTPYEATALGTPTVFSDHDIAAELNVAPAWIVPDGSVSSLHGMLDRAATEIAQAKFDGTELRVPELFSDEMRQSHRTAQMLETYERVLGWGEKR